MNDKSDRLYLGLLPYVLADPTVQLVYFLMSSVQVVRKGHTRLFTCQKMSVSIPSEIIQKFSLR